jgi:hypothetical protein
MDLTASNFLIQELEARFEMAPMARCNMDDCTGLEPGSKYGYYGSSWGNLGSGNGYIGVYTTNSGHVMLDDGSYTDQTSGSFPAYGAPPDPPGPGPAGGRCRCTVSRCM